MKTNNPTKKKKRKKKENKNKAKTSLQNNKRSKQTNKNKQINKKKKRTNPKDQTKQKQKQTKNNNQNNQTMMCGLQKLLPIVSVLKGKLNNALNKSYLEKNRQGTKIKRNSEPKWDDTDKWWEKSIGMW